MDIYEPLQTEQVSGIELWSQVHVNGSIDLPSADFESGMSGIFIANAPLGSGGLILEDPRGP